MNKIRIRFPQGENKNRNKNRHINRNKSDTLDKMKSEMSVRTHQIHTCDTYAERVAQKPRRQQRHTLKKKNG